MRCARPIFSGDVHMARSLAVIKASAYGHGAVACAKALAPQADGFAVAFIDESVHVARKRDT